MLDQAYKLVQQTVAGGGTILFVGTKRQAHETITEEAIRCGMPYVSFRWLGGMLTNWVTMRQRINELDRLERMREKGELEGLTKKERLIFERKIDKLQARSGGVRHMHKLPDLVFIIDIQREDTAVKEANTLKIPILALVDTNCDPREIDHVIPSNDDAIRAIKLMVGNMADAVLAGIDMRKDGDAPASAAPAYVEEQVEMSDEELLGESTIAKVEAAQAEEAVEAEETADAETSVEEAVEEVVEETADTKASVEEEVVEAVEETVEEIADVETSVEEVVEETAAEETAEEAVEEIAAEETPVEEAADAETSVEEADKE
jgi:small subunit ribosomal protein S2